jgi:hypothetical protein
MSEDVVKRILLMMKYDSKHTLTENREFIFEDLLMEQPLKGLFRALFGASSEAALKGSARAAARNVADDILRGAGGKISYTIEVGGKSVAKVARNADDVLIALSKGTLTKTSMGQLRVHVINSGANKAAKDVLIKQLANTDDLLIKASGKSKDQIKAGFKKMGYSDSAADEIATAVYKNSSKKSNVTNSNAVKTEYDRLLKQWQKEQRRLGKNTNAGQGTRDRLLKQAQTNVKGGKVTPIKTKPKKGTPGKRTKKPPTDPTGKKTRWQSFKEKAAATGTRLWGYKGVRYFVYIVGGALGLYLAYKFLTSRDSSPFPVCITGMAREEDLQNYADGSGDSLSIANTGNSELDRLGGGVFYDDGEFKTGNGSYTGEWEIDGDILYITAGDNTYEVQCAGSGDNTEEDGDSDSGDSDGGAKDDENKKDEEEKPKVSLEDGDANDPTVYADCTGEYKLGCTDIYGNIKEVQACLGLPTNGKFGPIMEKKLLAKWGKSTFKPENIWVICGRSAGDRAIY